MTGLCQYQPAAIPAIVSIVQMRQISAACSVLFAIVVLLWMGVVFSWGTACRARTIPYLIMYNETRPVKDYTRRGGCGLPGGLDTGADRDLPLWEETTRGVRAPGLEGQ